MDAEKSSNSSFEDLSNINEVVGDSSKKPANEDNPDKETAEKLAAPEDVAATATVKEAATVCEEQIKDDEKKDKCIDNSAAGSLGDNEPCDILGNGQIIKRVIKKSTSSFERPVRGDLVTLNFTGKLANDQIVEQEQDFQCHVGDFEVVQGLDMALPLMNSGEVAEIIVDARFAYNSVGLKNEENPEKSIPPNATITYVVHLLNIKCEEFSDIKSFEVRKKYGTRKKERANYWYNRNDHNMAIHLYKRALEYLDDREGDPDKSMCEDDVELTNGELQTLLEDRMIVHNNLAMAQIKIGAYDAALKSVDMVLRCQPNNSKALFRKGRIMQGKGDIKSAITFLQKAAILEPENKTIQQDLAKLIIKARREEHNEKELYQKMLGQAKQLEQKNNTRQKQQAPENSKLKMLGYLMGTVLIGVVGVAIYRYKY